MTLTYVLMQNLRRNPLRTVLTAAAFAFPMAVFVIAISFVALLIQLSAANEKELRLGVHHKTTLVNLLPEAIRRRIEGLDPDRNRVTSVCGMRWFGGAVPDTPNTITSLAADPDTFPQVYTDIPLTEAQKKAWAQNRRAAISGAGPATAHGWQEGSRVTLVSTVPPYLSLEFDIVAIMNVSSRANFFYFRRDYLDESLEEAGADAGRCNIFWVKCTSAEELRKLQNEIDAMTANSPDETKSEDENAFGANFTQAAGNIPGLMQMMAIVIVFVISLVAGNTMMMSFRERTRELAVFKAIGFQNTRIFVIVMMESLLLAFFGSLIGILPVAAWLRFFPLHGLQMGPVSTLVLSPAAVIGSIVISILVGLAAGVIPAYQALRLRTTDALRSLA